MDYATHIAGQEAHIRTLAADPGWRDYAVDKARRMAKHYPSLYAQLPAIVAATTLNPTHQETPLVL